MGHVVVVGQLVGQHSAERVARRKVHVGFPGIWLGQVLQREERGACLLRILDEANDVLFQAEQEQPILGGLHGLQELIIGGLSVGGVQSIR